jgi:hypothetical protein
MIVRKKDNLNALTSHQAIIAADGALNLALMICPELWINSPAQEKHMVKSILRLKEAWLTENRYLLKMGFSAPNKCLLKESTWQILKQVSPCPLRSPGLWESQADQFQKPKM